MKIDNSKRYMAKLKDISPYSTTFEVVSTDKHPTSSYGQQVWVDEFGNSYGQITLPLMAWTIESIKEITDEEADAWLEKEE